MKPLTRPEDLVRPAEAPLMEPREGPGTRETSYEARNGGTGPWLRMEELILIIRLHIGKQSGGIYTMLQKQNVQSRAVARLPALHISRSQKEKRMKDLP